MCALSTRLTGITQATDAIEQEGKYHVKSAIVQTNGFVT